MTSHIQTQMTQAWSAIYENTTQALQWVDEVRKKAPRLNSEAESIKLQLYRNKNLANSLRRVAGTPMTVGFFGLSQAGKSYLISALAANVTGDLITNFGGETLEFLEHINPTGGGKEATGLVTRFSRMAQASPDAAYPVELNLFKEIEVAMILSNAWFNDFDQELVNYEIDEALIQEHLKAFTQLSTHHSQSAVAPEDVVALMDYVGEKRSVSKLKASYWPTALQLITHLELRQRAELFSILWGQQPRITNVYLQLAEALELVGGASKVYAELSTLVQKTDSGYAQKNSIMNVDTLNLLGTAGDISARVRPVINGELQDPVEIKTAQLTALVSEMTFRLIDAPQDPVVEKVDLLDFPGYRSRLKMPTVKPLTEQSDIIAQLLLRGKVSYLFERYTNSQEMNGLIMCTNSNKQSEVVDVDKVLGDWIHKTQGASPTARATRKPGLMWAMTMMDMFVQSTSALAANHHPESCSNLMKITMLERFGKAEWMQDWNGSTFNNTFLVRKPRLDSTFLELDSERNEVGITTQASTAISELRQSFINNKSIHSHVAEPESAWDAMMTLNDGGITRLGQGIANVADPSFKLQRIQEQLSVIHDEIRNSLGQWYHQDADDAEGAQRTKAQLILQNLSAVIYQQGGELIHLLSLDDATVHNLFLSGEYETPDQSNENQSPAPAAAAMDFGGFDIGLTLAQPSATTQPTQNTQSHEQLFANAVYEAWIAHLRELSLKDSALQSLGIPNHEQVVPALIEELITASTRKKLSTHIKEKVLTRTQSNARHEQIAMRYVLNAQLSIQDFIAYLGYINESVASRPKNNQDQALFDFNTPLVAGEIPQLPNDATPPYILFLGHWMAALYTLILENAGHSAGREISVEQNGQLGTILRNIGII